MRISGLTHAASAPALLRFAFRVATHAQGWLPAGWLAFTGSASTIAFDDSSLRWLEINT
jgi:hypothetical protein